jgi:HEAT repeat protein
MWAADEKETGCPGNSVDDWIKRLKDDPDSIDRAKAAIRLRSFDDQLEKTIPPLIEALKDKANIVRACAATTLGSYGPKAKKALGPMCELFNDKNRFVRDDAAKAFVEISPESRQMVHHVRTDFDGQDVNLEFIQRGNEIFGLLDKDPKEVVPRLIDALKDKNAITRRCSVFALATLGPKAKEAIDPLIGLLKDKDTHLRSDAVRALGSIGKEAVDPLIGLLKDKDAHLRSDAVRALGSIGPEAEAAVGPIYELLEDKEAFVRHDAATALEKINPEVLQIVRLVRTDYNGQDVVDIEVITRASKLLALMARAGNKPVPQVIDALKDEKAAMRRCSALMLATLGPKGKDAIPALVESLRDKDRLVRIAVVSALVQIAPTDAKILVPALTQTLKDEDRIVRVWAIESLAKLGPDAQSALGAIYERLNDKEVRVQECALRGLYAISPEAADIASVQSRNGRKADELHAVSELLNLIGGEPKEGIPRLIEALKNKAHPVRASAAFVLATYGPQAKAAGDSLDNLLRDEEALVRFHAAFALYGISAEKSGALNPLIECLKDKDQQARMWAARALGEIGSAEAIGPLINAAKDKDENVRHSALGALCAASPKGKLTEKEDWGLFPDIYESDLSKLDEKALIELLVESNDPSHRYIGLICLALRGPESKEAVEDVKKALKDKDEKVRIAAAEALKRIDPDAAKKPEK